MDFVEETLGPLTLQDVENVMMKCRLRTHQPGLVLPESKHGQKLFREVLSGNTPRQKIYREIKRLGPEKTLCLLQLMFLGRFPNIGIDKAHAEAKKIEIENAAGYLSEKNHLLQFLEKGIERLSQAR